MALRQHDLMEHSTMIDRPKIYYQIPRAIFYLSQAVKLEYRPFQACTVRASINSGI